ncbi:MAG: prepilin-type N-terminal cleavage/methylation domain-containing protein [Kiritimatiellia bacterium]|jgi:prepilin-type N-terminal cleavage/methylation domain-containing protein|nr:prepilin-type N-terminal cleavage/methylation domain-containing protein [Kiritimatiellia bacterium]
MSRRDRNGFTLLELTLAIMILSVMMILSFFCFDAVVQSWNAGLAMSDSMAQADYVMEQIVSGLRSAYYPHAGIQTEQYGFQHTDGGEGAEAADAISWTKIGRALVGERTQLAEVPHRVSLSVEQADREHEGGLMAKVWRDALQLEDFDPEEDVKPFMLAPRVVGMDCRILKEPPERNATEIEWEDTWSESNAIPFKISLTLYMRPAKERDAPLAVTRDVEIPLWDISQNPVKQEQKGKPSGTRDTPGRPGGAQQPIPRAPGAGAVPASGNAPGGGRAPGGGGPPAGGGG